MLDKYFEAETTLEEEKLLALFFRQTELPAELEPLRVWFDTVGTGEAAVPDSGFGEEMMEKFRQVERHTKFRVLRMTLFGMAATLLIALGTTFLARQHNPYPDTFDDPELAMSYAGKTLQYVAEKYNHGMGALRPLRKVDEAALMYDQSFSSLNKGFKEIQKIQEIIQ